MGFPFRRKSNSPSSWDDVLYSKKKPHLQNISVRDPDHFVAGGLHRNPEAWDGILIDHPQKDRIRDLVRNKMKFQTSLDTSKALISVNTTAHISCCPCNLVTSSSCKRFSDFVSKEILKR